MSMFALLALFFFLLSLGAALLLAAASWRLRFLRRRSGPRAPVRPPVTILLPACADGPDLEANLRSFCRQDYPQVQILCGVREESDPAAAVVRRLMAEFPAADLIPVVDTGCRSDSWASSLASLLSAARHELLVLADSRLRVEPNWLATTAAAFSDPQVGAVTSPCSGAPQGGLAAHIAALSLTDGLLPALLLGRWGDAPLTLGATLAARRQTVAKAGGFPRLVPFSEEDLEFCRRLRRSGWRVLLSRSVVVKTVADPDLPSLLDRELAAARGFRRRWPFLYTLGGIAGSGMPFALLVLLLSRFSLIGWATVGTLGFLRLLLHLRVRVLLRQAPPFTPWLLPLRDLLAFGVWATALFRPRPGRSGQNLPGQPADAAPPLPNPDGP